MPVVSYEFLPPFVSPLTHEEHARFGRIALLWGQIDMMLDLLLELSIGISVKQRRTLIGEKPLGAKLDILSAHLDDISDQEARDLATEFWDLANQTKTLRNRAFHGMWGFRCQGKGKVVAAAAHYKAGDDPVRSTQLPALEKKLCKTARIGFRAIAKLGVFIEPHGTNRMFHGKGDRPAWLAQWLEQHPMDDDSLDRRWKLGRLPFLTKPL